MTAGILLQDLVMPLMETKQIEKQVNLDQVPNLKPDLKLETLSQTWDLGPTSQLCPKSMHQIA